MNRPILVGSVLVALAAALFGMLGLLTREAGALGLGAVPFVAWRAAIACAALLVVTTMLVATGRGGWPDPRPLAIGRRWGLGAACLLGALLNIAIFAAFLRMSIAVALITFYLFPAIVTIAAVRLYGERLDRIRLGALLLASTGLVLVVLAPALTAGGLVLDPLGVGLALFAAVCQAAFILISARGFRPMSSLHVATFVVAGAALVSLLLVPLAGELAGLLLPFHDQRTWAWIALAGLAGAAIPTTALLAGMGIIGPSRAAILMTIEPVVGVALAGVLLGEQPAPLQFVGGAAVLVAAAVLQAGPRAGPRAVPEEGEYQQLV